MKTKIKKAKVDYRANCRANHKHTGLHYGWFRDTSGNDRVEQVNPRAHYGYLFRTDKPLKPIGRPPKSNRGNASEHLRMRILPARKAHWEKAARREGKTLSALIQERMDAWTGYVC